MPLLDDPSDDLLGSVEPACEELVGPPVGWTYQTVVRGADGAHLRLRFTTTGPVGTDLKVPCTLEASILPPPEEIEDVWAEVDAWKDFSRDET